MERKAILLFGVGEQSVVATCCFIFVVVLRSQRCQAKRDRKDSPLQCHNFDPPDTLPYPLTLLIHCTVHYSINSFEEMTAESTVTTNPEKWNNLIWEYLTLEELLIFSGCSHRISSLFISSPTAQLLINYSPTAKLIDSQFLDLNHLTLGIFRKTIHRLVDGIPFSHSSLTDTKLSHGSIIPAAAAPGDGEDAAADDAVPIEKYLESNSFDEFDDFNPRHPDYKSHRRGGSFFNSDLSDIAAQVYATDLSLIAKKALDLSETDDMI
jgi:hypothetical protein